MDKYKWDIKLKRWFDLKNTSKIVYYRNPSEFKTFNIEMVNPTHKGIIWGICKKNNNFIKVVRLTIFNVFISFTDKIQNLLYYITENIDMFVLCYYIVFALIIYALLFNIHIIEGILCLKK